MISSDEENTENIDGWGALKARGAKIAARIRASRQEAREGEYIAGEAKVLPVRKDKNIRDISNANIRNYDISDDLPIHSLAPKKHHRKLGRKVLVFGHHKSVLDQIEEWLKLQDVGFVRLDGNSNVQKRSCLVKQFQEDDVTLVALCGITAVGTGYTLTRANIALFPEVGWSMGNMEQCEDRVHRIGQTAKEVRIIYYFAAGTGDEGVYRSLENKRDMVGSTVGLSGASANDNKHHAHFLSKDDVCSKAFQVSGELTLRSPHSDRQA